MRESGFCCAGCAYVNRLVRERGLDGYYRIKDSVTAPADAAVFQPRDYAWLEAAQRTAEGAGSRPELELDIQGVSCAGCVWLIERLFREETGGRSVIVNAQLGSMRLRWAPGEFSAEKFARTLQTFGYLLGPPDPLRSDSESRALIRRIGLCAAFAMNIMLFALPAYFGMEETFPYAGLFGVLALVFATLSFLVGGSYFLARAWGALRVRALHIDLPIAVGILGAYLGSVYGWLTGQSRFVYFDFVGTFILLMLIGRWAQVAAVERNRRRLLGRHPKPALVQAVGPGGALRGVPPESLVRGDSFLIPPGQTVPVESRLLGKEGSLSLASVSGEPEPRLCREGARVPSGALNVGRSELKLEALQPWGESLLAQLLKPSSREGVRHRLLERIVRGYLIGVFIAAVGAGIFWFARTGDGPRTWSVTTAVLVVSCPCAIGLAFPLADEMAATALRRRGVFVRDAGLWSSLGSVRKIVFDKTGTLTLETPVLQNPEELGRLAPPERSALLALVRDSAHPVGQCLLENLLSAGAGEPCAGEVRETPGFGLELTSEGGTVWSLGRAGWRTKKDGEAGSEFARDGKPVARFVFRDTARPDVRAELEALSGSGLEIFILSGDRKGKVDELARQVGIEPTRALGEMSPEGKASWMGWHGASDALMLGDGAYDSLAFDRALCRGTPVIHRGILEERADF